VANFTIQEKSELTQFELRGRRRGVFNVRQGNSPTASSPVDAMLWGGASDFELLRELTRHRVVLALPVSLACTIDVLFGHKLLRDFAP